MLRLKHVLLRTWVNFVDVSSEGRCSDLRWIYLPFKRYRDGPREQEADTLAPLEIQTHMT